MYLGPVAPHWEVRSDFGDPALIEEFRRRTNARLVFLPPHDPQYRRNRERLPRCGAGEHPDRVGLGEPEEEPVPILWRGVATDEAAPPVPKRRI